MANFKSLAKDTAIYGLSSIVGRFLNYLLVPLYAYTLTSTGEYGVITNLYAWTGLLLVILTYGMETTFFRFANKEGANPDIVYSTILRTITTSSLLFFALILIFLNQISTNLGYIEHPSYIWVMALTVAIDAFQAIPFAYLRYKRKPLKFAFLKLLFIGLSIFLNLLYFLVLPHLYKTWPQLIGHIYDPNIGLGYVFYINLFCTSLITLFFYKELRGFKFGFDLQLFKQMMSYTWPMLLLGIAGILNQTVDKILFPKIYHQSDADSMLGIYGACAKIASIMLMITQAFRYAYEPFVFGETKNKDNKAIYAMGMKYFIIFTLFAFLFVMSYLDIIKYLIKDTYWSGLKVIPILMAAQIMMGVYFNLSFWYKLTDKTIWGAIFSGIGCITLIAINLIFVPKYGYIACAWAGFIGYAVAMILSYIVGQKYYPISYPLKDIFKYLLITIVFFVGIFYSNYYLTRMLKLICNTALLCMYLGYVFSHDFPIYKIPVIGKYFKK